MAEAWHISSLLVTVHPKMLDRVAAAIGEIAGAEVAWTVSSGKIIVTMETSNEAEIVSGLTRIETLAGVVSAALVFHQTNSNDPDAEAPPAASDRETQEADSW